VRSINHITTEDKMSDKSFKSSLDWFQYYGDDARHVAHRFKTESIPAIAKRQDLELGADATDDRRQAWSVTLLESQPQHCAEPPLPEDIKDYTPSELLEYARTRKRRMSLNPRGIMARRPQHPLNMKREPDTD
jgi:hypothetical protein